MSEEINIPKNRLLPQSHVSLINIHVCHKNIGCLCHLDFGMFHFVHFHHTTVQFENEFQDVKFYTRKIHFF
eukprot:UN26768